MRNQDIRGISTDAIARNVKGTLAVIRGGRPETAIISVSAVTPSHVWVAGIFIGSDLPLERYCHLFDRFVCNYWQSEVWPAVGEVLAAL